MRGRAARRFLGEMTLPGKPGESLLYLFFLGDHPKQEPELSIFFWLLFRMVAIKINIVGIPQVFQEGSFHPKTGARDARAFRRETENVRIDSVAESVAMVQEAPCRIIRVSSKSKSGSGWRIGPLDIRGSMRWELLRGRNPCLTDR